VNAGKADERAEQLIQPSPDGRIDAEIPHGLFLRLSEDRITRGRPEIAENRSWEFFLPAGMLIPQLFLRPEPDNEV
jgi:hypothetical protein